MTTQGFEGAVIPHSLLTKFDVHLFREGRHLNIYEKLGSHCITHNGVDGTLFAVWAPSAREVFVIGSFNDWNRKSHRLFPRLDSSGIWEGFIPHVKVGDIYKYLILSEHGEELEKGDPYARSWEVPPKTASVVWESRYQWNDSGWMRERHAYNSLQAPISVYEMHYASWRRHENHHSLSYREMAVELVNYLKEMGYTHVEFMPLMEHPFDGSWGYQICGYFAPTSRFGTPEDFKFLIDSLHNAQIGVLLDWVPSHYPGDAHGLYRFDGSHLYEHADPRQGFHPDWNSYIFNFGRFEVRNFLLSNALYWFREFHIDGIRVDAVASMLYLDYSRNEGEWVPNIYGGRENLEAIDFLRALNASIYAEFPDVQTIAEESTSYPMISRPVDMGGLGFGMKWMMGWMNDTLEYFKRDPIHRSHHHNAITFSLTYAFSENFMLPLSHDEVAHGKGSLLNRMPGDEWQRFAQLRALYGYMFTHPGSKLLFMGGEFGQGHEWNHDSQLDWWVLDFPFHKGIQALIKALNQLLKSEPALYEENYSQSGFQWIDYGDHQNSVISYLRLNHKGDEQLLVACNFTPQTHQRYLLGAPEGRWKRIFSSDEEIFGGTGHHPAAEVHTENIPAHGRKHSLVITVPGLSVTVYKRQ